MVFFDKDKQKFPEAYDLTGQKIGKPRRKMKTENEKTLSIYCILDSIERGKPSNRPLAFATI